MDVKTYRLGDLIEELDRRNADLAYSYKDVRGVTNAKGIIRTKASISGRTLEKFYVIRPGEFVFNRRVHDKLGLGFNDSESTYIFGSSGISVGLSSSGFIPLCTRMPSAYAILAKSDPATTPAPQAIQWRSLTVCLRAGYAGIGFRQDVRVVSSLKDYAIDSSA